MSHYVYVLKSRKNGKHYVGETADLARRLKEHRLETTKSLRGHGPFDIVFFETYQNRKDARKRETYFKTGQGRRLRGELIDKFPRESLRIWQEYLGP
ncbi:MAG: GIY-YIG nuclease family protein [Actinomycetota bacterium]